MQIAEESRKSRKGRLNKGGLFAFGIGFLGLKRAW